MSRFTSNQTRAIVARGNVLVEAGAGAGKTSTLVERCIAWLLEGKARHSLDQILMVTFTEAAAAEMRQRIRETLTARLEKQPSDVHLAEQLALLETAHISTLHSFCLRLVREHFYELEIDPQCSVLAEEETRLLAEETLTALLKRHYAGATPAATAVQELIQSQARGRELPIRKLVRRVHEYTQTLPDPAGWFAQQQAAFSQSEPAHWRTWLIDGLKSWRALWLPVLRRQPPENINARQGAEVLEQFPLSESDISALSPTSEAEAGSPAVASTAQLAPAQIALLLARVLALDETWPAKKKTVLRKPLEKLFEEAAFFHSLASSTESADPLGEDWQWSRGQMATLLQLTEEFGRDFAEAKRELGAIDFHDLEQHALRLLWDPALQQPRPLAERWRQKLELIFVDEYQDINQAQDTLISALSRDGNQANRFLVGDVKQSIYRFRLAAPHIFQSYVKAWNDHPARGQVIPLSENFRSHESILNFINPFFAGLMRAEIGGVAYEQNAWLVFGNQEGRGALTVAQDATPRVELHLRAKDKDQAEGAIDLEGTESEGGSNFAGQRSDTEKEALLVGLRLLELKCEAYRVWDKEAQKHRPVEWKDMVILLRSPRGKVESYAKEFARLGVPLQAGRGGFFESAEILDLVSLLTLLDNPLQDVPALAVLRSPLAGLTLDELAQIRLVQPKGHYWTALQRFHRETSNLKPQSSCAQSAWPKVEAFLKCFAEWRRCMRQASLSECLERILSDTQYLAWALTQPRGEQRLANVKRFQAWAREFDQFQRQGLFRFLKFIEAQQAAEIDHAPAPLETENAVRLMSIHQSKGLEFPLVAVADLGKLFNFADLSEQIILDERYGLCPQVKPPMTEQRYPSLPYWLARRRQKRELLGEEMRLLYVAMTRACDLLLLAGTAARTTLVERWPDSSAQGRETQQVLAARSGLDWLGPWLPEAAGSLDWAKQTQGQSALLRWRIHDDSSLQGALEQLIANAAAGPPEAPAPTDAAAWQKLQERLSWQYPFLPATREPAKTSVTALRRRLALAVDDAATTAPWVAPTVFRPERRPDDGTLTSAEAGTAHHLFLQFVSWDCLESEAALRQDATRMEGEGLLLPSECQALDYAALAAFWSSDIGKKIRADRSCVHRELPFTARITAADLAEFNLLSKAQALPGEFVVVQGAADLVVILPTELWLLDFKTDAVAAADFDEKAGYYAPQIQLYALALGRIYQRPVTECWLHFLSLGRSQRVAR
ncbi:MAG: helicase-exonuclease AddAB subunit AddA [Verrucomicrobiota bacterium]